MAKWRYAFMFPGATEKFLPANAIKVFADAGFEFDRTIFPAVAVDEIGHLEYVDEVKLSGHTTEELMKRLGEDEQFQIECHNPDLFFSISFATKYANPHFMIGWSRRIFEFLKEEVQQKYLQLLRHAAQECNATYVISVDDPPDYFEDKFLEIDGQRILERQMSSGMEYDIRSVWIKVNSLDPQPAGLGDLLPQGKSDGFLEYSVV